MLAIHGNRLESNDWENLSMTGRTQHNPLADLKPIEKNQYLVNGRILQKDSKPHAVYSPFCIEGRRLYLGTTPTLGREEALEALKAAEDAFDRGLGPWPQMSPEERLTCLSTFLSKMEEKREEISQLIMLEIAKSRKDAYAEFDRTVQYVKDTMQSYRDLIVEDSKLRSFKGGLSAKLDRTPIGITLCMGPFNYPLNETFTSMIPALIMGNTIVMKPAKLGVLLFNPLLEALRDSFPPGVVNTIYGEGSEIITPIMESGKVDVLAFIGSTHVADILCHSHPAPHRLTTILGLGAHNPAILLPKTDVDRIMPEVIRGSLTFNGQRCTTLALHFVHSSQADEYTAKLAKSVSALKLGLPTDEGVQITDLAEGESKIRILKELINDAISKGARIVNERGGSIEENRMIPAVLYPVTTDMRIFHEEQFGPIVPVCAYEDLDSVFRLIADSRYGQQLSIFGEDREVIDETAEKLKNLVARVNINAACQRGPDELPFTGKKDGGLGVLSIRDALLAFSCPTVIAEKIVAEI